MNFLDLNKVINYFLSMMIGFMFVTVFLGFIIFLAMIVCCFSVTLFGFSIDVFWNALSYLLVSLISLFLMTLMGIVIKIG